MSRSALRASLLLWQRRLAYRQLRLRVAIRSKNKPRILHWQKLVNEADALIARRRRQLAPNRITRVGARGVSLIKSFEGFVGHPYRDAVGVWTIGYGHTEGVGPGSKPLTEPQAASLLRQDLDRKYAPAVAALKLPLKQNQFDALVSFVYNVGPGGIGPTTGVGRALRAHDWKAAADHLLEWDMAGGRHLPGLTRRRHAERDLFLS